MSPAILDPKAFPYAARAAQFKNPRDRERYARRALARRAEATAETAADLRVTGRV